MVINPETTNEFIQDYKAFLLYACSEEQEVSETDLLVQLAQGRDAFMTNRELLSKFRSKYKGMPEWLFRAIEQLEVADWVYLKDTTKYSLFIPHSRAKHQQGY